MTAPADVVPGVYDIDEATYHADPVPGGSLSSTGARRLLPPGCPAQFKHERDHGQQPKRHLELGTIAHKLVLGSGPDIDVLDFDNYQTKAAQQQRDEARAAGHVPLLRHEYEQAQAMADAIRRHSRAGRLLAPGSGEPEQTLIWRDEETGVWCRARLDWLGVRRIVDLKTTTDASPEAIQKAIWTYRYHQQRGWYVDGHRAVLGEDADFTFVFVAKTPPYLVTVVELDDVAALAGDARNHRARHIYADCVRTGHWPDHGDLVHHLPLPPYAEARDMEEYL